MRIAFLIAGAVLLGALLWRLGPAQIIDAVGRIRWYVLPVLCLGGAHQVVRALALRACVLRAGILRYRDALAIRLSGEAIQSLTFTGPIVAEPTKAWLLTRRGLTLREGFAATLTEYLIYTFVTAVMSVIGLLYLIVRFDPPAMLRGIAIGVVCACAAFLIASAIAIARRFYLIGTIIAWLARAGVLRGRLTPDMTWINQMEDLLLLVLRDSPGRFVMVAAIEIAAQALLVVELFWLFRALGVTASGWSAFVVEASVKFFEFAFVFVPLQLGVSEGAYALVCGIMSLPLTAGFAVAFVRRARSLVIAAAGLVVMAVITRRRRRLPPVEQLQDLDA
ncbi:MAG: hypothetical protein DMF87_25045 [Acidobacteria bacterium]|nr:MAG: hypothetical protein DMF87_25045 [Acidobacteriota bacterium]